MAKKEKKKIIIKTISFNEEDRLLLDFLEKQRNTSAYIRELIEKDMREKSVPTEIIDTNNGTDLQETEPTELKEKKEEVKENTNSIYVDDLKDLLPPVGK